MKYIKTLALGAYLFVSAGIPAYGVEIPHTFKANTPAKAEDVNANFKVLADGINSIPAGTQGIQGIQGTPGTPGTNGTNGSPDTPDQVREKFVTGTSCINPNNPNDIIVKVGPLCIDKYETSVWTNPDGTGLQRGAVADNYCTAFPDNGNWTSLLYAVSKRNEALARFITWFQAHRPIF